MWFQHVGQDLQVTAIDAAGKVTLKNWYAGSPERPHEIVAGDGKKLSSYRVESLVQAMAAFNAPGGGATTFVPGSHEALQPILAANWR